MVDCADFSSMLPKGEDDIYIVTHFETPEPAVRPLSVQRPQDLQSIQCLQSDATGVCGACSVCSVWIASGHAPFAAHALLQCIKSNTAAFVSGGCATWGSAWPRLPCRDSSGAVPVCFCSASTVFELHCTWRCSCSRARCCAGGVLQQGQAGPADRRDHNHAH